MCNQCLAAEVHYTGPEGARAKATKVVRLNIALLKTIVKPFRAKARATKAMAENLY